MDYLLSRENDEYESAMMRISRSVVVENVSLVFNFSGFVQIRLQANTHD